jgi:hypothetical protein
MSEIVINAARRKRERRCERNLNIWHPEDQYGNPRDGNRLIYCCFPDCGCDGARLCMAENGASDRACDQNVEAMWSGKTIKQRAAVFSLIASLSTQRRS